MPNKDIIKITFDTNTKEFEKSLISSMSDISDAASEKLTAAFLKAGKDPKLKKQLTGVYQGLFDDLTDASSDLDRINDAIDRFVGKIDYIDKVAKKSKIAGLFDNLSIENVDKILAGYDEILKKEKDLAKYSSEKFRDDVLTRTKIKSLKALENAYGDTEEAKSKYEQRLNEYIKTAGIETSLISKEIKEYSSLVALFEKINNTKVSIGTEEAVKKNQALLYVMKQIKDLETGSALFSNFRKNELKNVDRITSELSVLEQSVKGSVTKFITELTKPIKAEIANIYQTAIDKALKFHKHQDIAARKTQEKVDAVIGKGGGKGTGSGDENKNDPPSPFEDNPDGIDVWVKSAEELKNEFQDVIKYATDAEKTLNRINDIWERYSKGGKIVDGEIEEMFILMKRLDSLEQNKVIEKSPLNKEQLEEFNDILFDDDYEKVFSRIDELTERQLKRIEELKAAQKGLDSGNKIGGTGNVDDSKVEELREEIKEVKEDISSLKGRVDTLEDTTAFDTLSSKVDGFDEKIKSVDGSVENLVNSFKLLSELSLTDLQRVVIPLFNSINQLYSENDGKHISEYWNTLKEGVEGSNTELAELLKLVGLYNSKSNGLKLISDGMENSGGLIGDDKVLIARKNNRNQFEEKKALVAKLEEAYKAGVNVARILDIIGTKESKVFFDIQEKASGNILSNPYGQNDVDFINTDWFGASEDQIKKLISDLITLQKLGINVESNLTNIMFDEKKGFTLIDMDLGLTQYENNAELIEDHIMRMFSGLEEYYEDRHDDANLSIVAKARERFEKLSEEVQKAYVETQDSPSKGFEKLEDDAVDGIVAGVNKNEGKLKNVGQQMAESVKDGFKEEMSDVDTATLSLDGKNDILSENVNSIDKLEVKLDEVAKSAEKTSIALGYLYHGSNADFEEFDLSYQNMATYGAGVYLTPDKDFAKGYGKNIYECFADINNTFLSNAKLSEEEISKIFKEYTNEIIKMSQSSSKRWGLEKFDVSTFEGFSNYVKSNFGMVINVLREIAKYSDKIGSSSDILSFLGYDSYFDEKRSTLSVFDPSNVKILSKLLDISHPSYNKQELNKSPLPSDISQPLIEDHQNVQEELRETREEIDKTENALVTYYRGVDLSGTRGVSYGEEGAYKQGSTSETPWWSTSLEVAKEYAGTLGEIYSTQIELNKVMTVDAQGEHWNHVLYLGDGSDEESKKAISFYQEMIKYRNQLKSDHGWDETADGMKNIMLQGSNEAKKAMMDYQKAKLDFDKFIKSQDTYGYTATDDLAIMAKDMGYQALIVKNVMDSKNGIIADNMTLLTGTKDGLKNLTSQMVEEAETVNVAASAEEKLADVKKEAMSEQLSLMEQSKNDVDEIRKSEEEVLSVIRDENKELEKFNNLAKELYEFTDDIPNNIENIINIAKSHLDETSNFLYHAGILKDIDLSANKSHPLGTNSPDRQPRSLSNLTGLYTTNWLDSFIGTEWNDLPISIIDKSKLGNLFAPSDRTIGRLFKQFSYALEESIYQYSYEFKDGKTDKTFEGIKSIDELYELYKQIFGNLSLTKDKFEKFVNESQQLIKNYEFSFPSEDVINEYLSGSGNKLLNNESIFRDFSVEPKLNAPSDIFNLDSFITQLLKKMGYSGTDMRNAGYDGTYSGGSVLFDVPKDAILEVDKPFNEVLNSPVYFWECVLDEAQHYLFNRNEIFSKIQDLENRKNEVSQYDHWDESEISSTISECDSLISELKADLDRFENDLREYITIPKPIYKAISEDELLEEFYGESKNNSKPLTEDQKELQAEFQKTQQEAKDTSSAISLFEEESGQLSFVEQTKKTVDLIEEESGQMSMFETVAEKATNSAIEGQMTLNDVIDKNIESQMTLNDLLDKNNNDQSFMNVLSDTDNEKNIENTTNAVTELTTSLKELIISWIEAQKIMTKSDVESQEKIAFANLGSDFVSNSHFTGDLNSVSDKLIKNIIESATDTIDTMLHSHPDYHLAAFSPEDITYSILRFATGIKNQIIVGMDEISVMDVSKIKDINPIEIREKIEQELSSLINSYVANQLQSISKLQSVFNNTFENGVYEWEGFVDLISENTNSDLLKKVIQKYKDFISDSLIYMDSDYKFNNSDDLGLYIYENIIKKHVKSYIGDYNPDIKQSEYDELQKEALENFKKEFSYVYNKVFSLEDYKSLLSDNEIQPIVKEAFSNILKTFGLKYEDVIKTISVDQIKSSSDFLVKDNEVVKSNIASTNSVEQHTSYVKEDTSALEKNTDSLKENEKAQKKQADAKKEAKITNPSKEGFEAPDGWVTDVDQAWDDALLENIEQTAKAYKDLTGKLKKYYDLKNKELKGNKLTPDESDTLDKLNKEIEEAISGKGKYSNATEKAAIAQKKFNDALKDRNQNYSDTYLNDIKSLYENKKFISDTKMPEYKNILSEINKQIELISAKTPIDFTNESQFEDFKKARKEIDKLFNDLNSKSLDKATTTEVDTVLKNINKRLNQSSAMPKEYKDQLKALRTEIELLSNSASGIDKITLANFKSQLVSIENQIEKTGRTGLSLMDKIKRKVKDLAAYFLTYVSFQDFIQVLRQGFEAIKEYDTALTEMKKVSDESISTLKSFQKESFELADSVGTTAKQIQNSTADWMRLGESLEDAKKSAQSANILYNVSEFDSIDAATESLVSMSQAFKDLEKGEIIDVVNNLGNNFAISTDGLATALQNSASALQTAKNDFFESAALTTAANTVVQDPNKVGAGLRTIALRLTGTEAAKKELEELGEDISDFTVTTTSKLNQQIIDLTKTQDGFGVSLLDVNGNYRSTYDILLDIANVWEQIAKEDLATGENRQNALLEMMAGEQFCLKFVETHFYRTHLIARIA